jgi:hypothetical protein
LYDTTDCDDDAVVIPDVFVAVVAVDVFDVFVAVDVSDIFFIFLYSSHQFSFG